MKGYVYRQQINDAFGNAVGCKELYIPQEIVKDIRNDTIKEFQEWLKTQIVGIDNKSKEILVVVGDRWELATEQYIKEHRREI